jgi:hypothetical protein
MWIKLHPLIQTFLHFYVMFLVSATQSIRITGMKMAQCKKANWMCSKQQETAPVV